MKKRDDRSALLLGKIVSWDDERAEDTTKFCRDIEFAKMHQSRKLPHISSNVKLSEGGAGDILGTCPWGWVSWGCSTCPEGLSVSSSASLIHRHCPNRGISLWLKQVPQALLLSSPHPPVTVPVVPFPATWQRVRQPFFTAHTAVKGFISNGSKGQAEGLYHGKWLCFPQGKNFLAKRQEQKLS